MTDKVFIIGSEGMLGHVLADCLKGKQYCVFTSSRNKRVDDSHFCIDIFDTDRVKTVLASVKPNYVINCVGILVKNSEKNPDQAIFVNSYFPHFLDRLSAELSYKLIHISTDCVFNGDKGSYTIEDMPNEMNFYGRSKALGEIVNNRNLTIRTSIVGPEIKQNGTGLLHWFMMQKSQINGYTRVIWSGVTTLELAKFIDFVLSQDSFKTGLYHLSNNQSITKRDLLQIFKKTFQRHDVDIQDDHHVASNKSLLSNLDEDQYKVPNYIDMVTEMRNWMEKHRHQYPFYYLKS